MSNTGWVVGWRWRSWVFGFTFGPEVWLLSLGPFSVGFDPEMWKFTRLAKRAGVETPEVPT